MRRLLVTVAALAAAAAGAGCGEDSAESSSSGAKPVGLESAGSTVQFADCKDWRRGSPAERRATVEAIRGHLTPQSSKTAASPLPDDRAYTLLDQTCSTAGAESLRLYKLYARMQGFAPLMD